MIDLGKHLDRQLIGLQDPAERPELQRAVAPREGARWQTSGEFRDTFCLVLADIATRTDADGLPFSDGQAPHSGGS